MTKFDCGALALIFIIFFGGIFCVYQVRPQPIGPSIGVIVSIKGSEEKFIVNRQARTHYDYRASESKVELISLTTKRTVLVNPDILQKVPQ